MTFTDYFRDKLLLLMLQVFCMMLLTAFLHVTNYPAANCGIILILWTLIFLTWFVTEYLRRRHYFRQMEEILEQADQKFLLGELMPQSFRLEDKLYRNMIRKSNKSVIEKIHAVEDARQDYREYIESWIHEVKAPIANITLLCSSRRILQENQKIENYVDMALFYARSDEVYRDYLIRETSLQKTAEEVLQKNKYHFIQCGIQAQVNCPDTVYTDTKWIAFILNQLILNAVKYRRETAPEIKIFTEKKRGNVCLAIADNGLGIPAEELPRIFDKGFTGTNGRICGRSTGMGLYLCRKLGTKLGIQIYAQSEPGMGTKILLEFPVSSYFARS